MILYLKCWFIRLFIIPCFMLNLLTLKILCKIGSWCLGGKWNNRTIGWKELYDMACELWVEAEL
jgi:hypothetical protein